MRFCRNIDNLDDLINVAISVELGQPNQDRSSACNTASSATNVHSDDRMIELYEASRALEEPLDIEPNVSLESC